MPDDLKLRCVAQLPTSLAAKPCTSSSRSKNTLDEFVKGRVALFHCVLDIEELRRMHHLVVAVLKGSYNRKGLFSCVSCLNDMLYSRIDLDQLEQLLRVWPG